jgi:uncharacterized protein YodC (DUF2158 family)
MARKVGYISKEETVKSEAKRTFNGAKYLKWARRVNPSPSEGCLLADAELATKRHGTPADRSDKDEYCDIEERTEKKLVKEYHVGLSENERKVLYELVMAKNWGVKCGDGTSDWADLATALASIGWKPIMATTASVLPQLPQFLEVGDRVRIIAKKELAIGDKVKIVAVRDDKKHYPFSLTDEMMRKYRGKTMTISRISTDGSDTKYSLKEDDGFYAWSLPMFEGTAVPIASAEDRALTYRFARYPRKRRFEVGDVVRIKKGLRTRDGEPWCSVVRAMSVLGGRKAVITEVNTSYGGHVTYKLDVLAGFSWSAGMFE